MIDSINQMTNDYYKSENLISTKEHISTSGKYKLIVETYITKPGCWNYTKGIIHNIETGSVIQEIKRNYCVFHHSFFFKDNQEWLFCGKTYYSQCFINLETGEIFDNSTESKPDSFCWANVKSNPDGNIIIVEQCIWGGPYEIGFYDFTDPSIGWTELEFDNYQENYYLNIEWNYESKWLDNDTFEYIQKEDYSIKFQKFYDELTVEEELESSAIENDLISRMYYRVVLKKIDNKMRFMVTESSPQHLIEIQNNNE
ncbi:hypothetical protein LBA_00934 [Megavirus lba]|uniref:Uncharacterized protein n=1 Tax=Megavirus lba TaxID=1235314 RepID=L7Y3Z1_9VIRU|nr:hypothetical protein LBA_00934 [Megavirus lba]